MSNKRVYFKATFGEYKTLSKVSEMLEKRRKYLGESAFQSTRAIAIDTLKSIRGLTKVAKPSSLKVELKERSDLHFSYTTEAASHKYVRGADGMFVRRDFVPRKMCLRHGAGMKIAARYSPGANEKIVFDNDVRGKKLNVVKVFEFVDTWAEAQGLVKKTYLIAALSSGAARKLARQIVARRLLRFAGLAKRAISALMLKANSKAPSDMVNAAVFAKAKEVTDVRDIIAEGEDGGKYALVLDDNLRYAAAATCLKGGQAAVDLALKKAANRSAGLIQQKCKKFLLPGELSTPFPEVTKKRKVA